MVDEGINKNFQSNTFIIDDYHTQFNFSYCDFEGYFLIHLLASKPFSRQSVLLTLGNENNKDDI